MFGQKAIRSILGCLVASSIFLLSACGSSEDTSGGVAKDFTASTNIGLVIGEKGPVADAKVVIKAANGQEVGQVTTNSQGEYRISTNQPGPFVGEATLPSGKVWFGIGESANMNITHLGDFLLRLWYQAKNLNVSSVFSSLGQNSPVPQGNGLMTAANQLVSVPAYALGTNAVNLFGYDMTPTLKKIIQGTRIVGGGQININLPEINFKGNYHLEAVELKNGEVVFKGFEETQSINVPITKGPVEAVVGSLSIASSGRLKNSIDNNFPNEHWMKDNWDFLKDKRYDQLVIPGTHDSGTYMLGWGTGKDTAKTQTNSIGDQLRDGIRYFDLRVREAKHYDCADPSVWWIYHNWDSYRLQVALDEINTFLLKPGNENEVIILDFQDTKIIYDDARARHVLLGMIQDKLGKLMAKNEGGWTWQKASLQNLVDKNKRVIVLLENFLYTEISKPDFKPGCGVGKIDYDYFSNRTTAMVSAYDEDFARSATDMKYLIESELNKDFKNTRLYEQLMSEYVSRMSSDSGKLQKFKEMIAARITKYKDFTQSNKLRVHQLVSRPPDSWYVLVGGLIPPPPPIPSDLLSYATQLINKPLNVMEQPACQEGWLGKRLRMGIEGGETQWNFPNIIIADNYRANEWVVPDLQGDKWVKGRQYTDENKSKSYVDMAIELNKIKPSSRLSGVSFEDGKCLQ